MDPDDTFWHLYTSGTTGRPKGALLTHRNLYADTQHNIIGNRLNRDDPIYCMVLPMFHIVLKLIIIAAYTRAAMVFLDKFDLKELCEAIEKEKVRKVVRKMFDEAMIIPIHDTGRAYFTQEYVHDVEHMAWGAWPNWRPDKAWLSK